jgi:hypothetical protein
MKQLFLVSGKTTKFPAGELITWSCCDCGLVHQVVLHQFKKKVGVTMWRDEYLTSKERKCNIRREKKHGQHSNHC